MQTGEPDSVKCFVEDAKIREGKVYYRIEEDTDGENLISDTGFKWHKSCYVSYASLRNFLRSSATSHEPAQDTSNSDKTDFTESGSLLERSESVTNWSVCLFCQQYKCKQDVAAFPVSKNHFGCYKRLYTYQDFTLYFDCTIIVTSQIVNVILFLETM